MAEEMTQKQLEQIANENRHLNVGDWIDLMKRLGYKPESGLHNGSKN